MNTPPPTTLLGLVVLALSCSSAQELDVQQDPLAGETLTLSIVRLDRQGMPTVRQKLITRRQQLDMADRRAIERGLTPLGGVDGKLARKSQAIESDPDCGGASLWIFDQENLGGNMACFHYMGKIDLSTVCAQWTWVYQGGIPINQYCSKYWHVPSTNTSNIKSYWAGVEPGSVQYRPNGACSTTCTSWSAYQRVNSLNCSYNGRWLDLAVWGTACWLDQSAYSFVWESPDNEDYNWTDGHQGIAHSATTAYFARTFGEEPYNGRLSMRSLELSIACNMPETHYDDGYWHYGDPDFYNGFLWVPAESDQGSLPHLFAASPDLTQKIYDVPFPDGTPDGFRAWVAWNPTDGTLYATPWFDDVSEIRQYVFLSNPSPQLVLVRSVPLIDGVGNPVTIHRVQGGAFSQNGHLYLTADDRDNPSNAGFYGVDAESGTVHFHKHFAYNPGWLGDEIEGIDINSSWTMYPGTQIHISMIDGDAVDDDIYLKHFSISDMSKL